MGMRVEWLEDPGRWQALAPAWDRAAYSARQPSIFNTFDFLETSWRRFAEPYGNRLALLLLLEGDDLLGHAALRLSTRRRWRATTRVLKRLASWEADRPPFALPAGREIPAARLMVQALEERSGAWDAIELDETAPDDPFLVACHERVAERRPWIILDTEGSPSPYIRLDGDWEGYLEGLGARTRKHVRRHTRADRPGGPYQLTSSADMDALDEYIELEGRSWKRQAGQGIAKNTRTEVFYRELSARLAPKGRFLIQLLRISGRPVAGLVELQLGATVYATQTAFDSGFAHLSPGTAVQALSLERHASRGVREYELFAQFLTDKLRWTRESRPNRTVALLQVASLRQGALAWKRLRRREASSVASLSTLARSWWMNRRRLESKA